MSATVPLGRTTEVVVVGAGIVGAACALAVARAGVPVTVLDRGAVGGATSSAGEGNLLVSDKPAGPELDLARHSLGHWEEVAGYLGELTGRPGGGFELDHKGGLVVAALPQTLAALGEIAQGQRAAGVEAVTLDGDLLPDVEPHLARGLAGGVLYPQDGQLHPVLATARMLAAARRHGAVVHARTEVVDLVRSGDRVRGVVLSGGERIECSYVVNATGPWSRHLAALAGVHVPVMPRRGVVLVTQPLPPLIRRKVYDAGYLATVASDSAGLESSAVVEGTPSGAVLVGASRERVGFDPGTPVTVVRRLAAQAIALFPVLAGVRLLRTYRGFRPYSPDHLPVIGADPRAPGLVHACGHEGAGVVLAAGTGQLVAEIVTGVPASADLHPVRPDRFETGGGM
jgi:glycine/D-amino acid oxidase-like deaminating enzyme